MPRLSVVFLRIALGYLSAGAVIGSVLLWEKGSGSTTLLWVLRETHVVFLTMGFLVHFVAGTAWWIFPRIQKSRGHEGAMTAGAVLLNLGVGLECAGSLWSSAIPFPGSTALMETAGILCMLSQLGPRIVQRFVLRR